MTGTERFAISERQRAMAAQQPSPSRATYSYLDDARAEEYLGFPPSKGKVPGRRVKDLRRRGGGPRYVRVGSAVRYRSDWLDQWAEANAVTNTSQEAARNRT